MTWRFWVLAISGGFTSTICIAGNSVSGTFHSDRCQVGHNWCPEDQPDHGAAIGLLGWHCESFERPGQSNQLQPFYLDHATHVKALSTACRNNHGALIKLYVSQCSASGDFQVTGICSANFPDSFVKGFGKSGFSEDYLRGSENGSTRDYSDVPQGYESQGSNPPDLNPMPLPTPPPTQNPTPEPPRATGPVPMGLQLPTYPKPDPAPSKIPQITFSKEKKPEPNQNPSLKMDFK